MTRNKIKRGEDWIDYDLLSNDVNAKWSDYTTDYDFGKGFNFDLMNKYRDQILKGLIDGYIVYNPTSDGSKYLYSLTKNIPEFDPKSKEAMYAAGLIGQQLSIAKAIEEEPWNASDYFGKIIKDTYFKGQEPNFEYLAKLTQDQKKNPYLEFINSLQIGKENIPEVHRSSYDEFFLRSSKYMDDGEITPEELADLVRYTGNGQYWEWLQKPVVAKVDKKDEVKDEEKPKIEVKKDLVTYENYADLTNLNIDKIGEYTSIINQSSAQGFMQILSKALSHPDKYPEQLAAAIGFIASKENKKKGKLELPISSDNYKYFYDFATKKVLKSNKSNFAEFENVKTPEVKPEKEKEA